jgi:hypothetical protein
MYCSSCGTPVTSGLSFCNRCGTSLKEREESKNTGVMSVMVIAMTLVGLGSLGILLGGSVVLRKEADLPPEIILAFMLCVLVISLVTEFSLVRNLSKLVSSSERQRQLPSAQSVPADLRLPQATPFGEPVSSVTDSTTRTLEYSRRQQ